MSTADLSPLEQLSAMGSQKQATPSDTSGLSPLEQLAAMKPAQPKTEDVDPSTISTGGEGSNTDQQLMSEESQKSATKGGLLAGAAGALGIAGATLAPEAVIAHLVNLDKIVKAAKGMGYVGFGIKEAHDLYKTLSADKK